MEAIFMNTENSKWNDYMIMFTSIELIIDLCLKDGLG